MDGSKLERLDDRQDVRGVVVDPEWAVHVRAPMSPAVDEHTEKIAHLRGDADPALPGEVHRVQ